MNEKEVMMLRDPAVPPTEELIFECLGAMAGVYRTFIEESENQEITLMDWRFYNDGKAWLAKGEYHWTTSRGTKKVKPIFWLSIWAGFFKVSFNFKEETRAALLELPLSEGTKAMISQIEANGKKLKYIPIIFDVADSGQLADIAIIAKYRKQNI